MTRSRLGSSLIAVASAALVASSLWVAPASVAATSPEPTAPPSAEAAPDESPSPEPSASPSPNTSPSSAPSPSPVSTETCEDDTPCLLAPQITGATPMATEIAVAWEWPEGASNFGDGVGVVLEVTPGDVELVANDDVTTAVIANLFPETTYTIVAYAVRGAGDAEERSAGSEAFTVTTLAEGPIRPTAEDGDISRLIVTTYSDANPSAGAQSATADLPVQGVDVTEVREIGNEGVVIELDKGVSNSTARLITDELERDPRIESVELDGLVRLGAFPADPPNDNKWTDNSLWGLYGNYGIGIASDRFTMNNVWTSGQGNGAIVAVLDTGYTAHPDLDANYVAGYDFVSSSPPFTYWCDEARTIPGWRTGATDFDGDYINTGTYGALGWDSNPLDPGDWDNCGNSSWHGTHVAGTVAAVGNNAAGIVGVAPQAKVQPIRVLSHVGGFNSDIAAGITWASGGSVGGSVPVNPNPADVINLSLGGRQSCPASIQTAIDAAVNRGSVVVVSAGNSSLDAALFSPANCNNVITVASSTSSGVRSSFSNFGSTVEITAPGSGIWSTLNSGSTTPVAATYASYSGTSMAAPHVSGVAALLKAADDNRTPSQVLSLLQVTAQAFPVTGSGFDCTTSACGSGLLTASAAISTAPSATSLTPTTGSTAGGVAVTITGTNLLGTTSVSFGGAAATDLIVNSATSVTVTTPARAAGQTDVVVTGTGGSSTLASAFTFVTPPPSSGGSSSGGGGGGGGGGSSSEDSAEGGGGGGLHSITTIVPSTSGVAGSTIALAGWGLETTREVMFNDVSARFTIVNGGHIQIVVPDVPAGVYVIHAVLAPDVGRASFWSGFTVQGRSAPAPGTPPSANPPVGSAPVDVAEATADFVSFTGTSTELTKTTRSKLTRMAGRYASSDDQATIVAFTDARGTAASTRRAQVRAEKMQEFMQTAGFSGPIQTVIEPGSTRLQSRGALVYVQPVGTGTASANEDSVRSLIVRLKKDRSITVDGEVRGSDNVTGPIGDSLIVGPYLGLRMYRVDFAEPVSEAVAERVAKQLAQDRGIEFAEPDSIVSTQVSITL